MRIFITGSSTGLGQMAARYLSEAGHHVVIHGRSPSVATASLGVIPNVQAAVHGDLTSLKQVCSLADQVNQLGRFDAVIHNAAIGAEEADRVVTEDGLPRTFAINVLAPYVLTALIQHPARLIYLSSSMQIGVNGRACLDDLLWEKRPWNGVAAYSESKLLISMLAFNVAQRWPQVLANTVDPGWVATRMGGEHASDDLDQGHLTQSWLAVSNDSQAQVTGQHFYHMTSGPTNPDALNPTLQAQLIAECERLSGVSLPV